MHLSLFMYKIKAPKGQGNLSKKWKKIFFNQLYSSRIFFLYINNRIIIVLEKKRKKTLQVYACKMFYACNRNI